MGACHGRQTVGRAELCAAIWASMAGGPCTLIVAGSRYVRDGIDLLRKDGGQDLLEGEDGDLWRQLAPALPITRWVPSHVSAAEAVSRGVSLEDWVGNHYADEKAKSHARTLAPAEEFVERRMATLAALEIAQSVIAHIEEAVMSTPYAQE